MIPGFAFDRELRSHTHYRYDARDNKRYVCMKRCLPPLTNVGTETAFRHDHLQAFAKN